MERNSRFNRTSYIDRENKTVKDVDSVGKHTKYISIVQNIMLKNLITISVDMYLASVKTVF